MPADTWPQLLAAGYLRRRWSIERAWLHFAGTLSLADIEAIAARLAAADARAAEVR